MIHDRNCVMIAYEYIMHEIRRILIKDVKNVDINELNMEYMGFKSE